MAVTFDIFVALPASSKIELMVDRVLEQANAGTDRESQKKIEKDYIAPLDAIMNPSQKDTKKGSRGRQANDDDYVEICSKFGKKKWFKTYANLAEGREELPGSCYEHVKYFI